MDGSVSFQRSFVCRYCKPKMYLFQYLYVLLGIAWRKLLKGVTFDAARSKRQGDCPRFLWKHTGSGRQPWDQIPEPHVRLLLLPCKEVPRDAGFLAPWYCINSRVGNRAPSSPWPPPENYYRKFSPAWRKKKHLQIFI